MVLLEDEDAVVEDLDENAALVILLLSLFNDAMLRRINHKISEIKMRQNPCQTLRNSVLRSRTTGLAQGKLALPLRRKKPSMSGTTECNQATFSNYDVATGFWKKQSLTSINRKR